MRGFALVHALHNGADSAPVTTENSRADRSRFRRSQVRRYLSTELPFPSFLSSEAADLQKRAWRPIRKAATCSKQLLLRTNLFICPSHSRRES